MIDSISIRSLNKFFGSKQVLNNLSLGIKQGEMVALIGASGSGKSTLLRHLSGLTCANTGTIEVLGKDIQSQGILSHHIRRHRSNIGYIFQQFNLINRLNVIDNVLLGCLGRIPRWRGCCALFEPNERFQAMAALERVGLSDFANCRASTLSGGQQQRVAIARVLMQQADIILADEPIASLDPESARIVMEILSDINKQDGKTVVVSLHQVNYARHYCRRAIALKNGKIHYDGEISLLDDDLLSVLYGAHVNEMGVTSALPAALHEELIFVAQNA